VLAGRAEACGDQDRAELIAVQGGGVRLIIQPGTADVRCGRVLQEFFFDRVFVEPGDRAQPPGDGGASAAACFQLAGEGLDVARRTESSGSDRTWRQLVNWRRSRV
jgi:hypothetical protein